MNLWLDRDASTSCGWRRVNNPSCNKLLTSLYYQSLSLQFTEKFRDIYLLIFKHFNFPNSNVIFLRTYNIFSMLWITYMYLCSNKILWLTLHSFWSCTNICLSYCYLLYLIYCGSKTDHPRATLGYNCSVFCLATTIDPGSQELQWWQYAVKLHSIKDVHT